MINNFHLTLTFYTEANLSFIGLHVHGLVPNRTLVGGHIIIHCGHYGERVVCGSIRAGLLDFYGAACRGDNLIVAEPGDIWFRIAALR